MLNRYEDPAIDLPIEDRPGPTFIGHADGVYQIIKDLVDQRKIKFDKPTQKKYDMLITVSGETHELIKEYENSRIEFDVPKALRENYLIAKRSHELLTKNPQIFYEENDEERQALEREKEKLAMSIKKHEVGLARMEDVIKHDIKNKRSRYSSMLAALQVEKRKYGAKVSRHQNGCFPSCFRAEQELYGAIDDRIQRLKVKIDGLGKEEDEELKAKRYMLGLATDKRWKIDKELHDFKEGDADQQRERLHEATDDTEVMLIVRQKEIDEAIERYYAAYNPQLLHALLRLYILMRDCYDSVPHKSEEIRINMRLLDETAETIHGPKIANRSILTLYKKAQLVAGNLMQVVYAEPTKDKLPEVLARTLSIKNMPKEVGGLGLFKRAAPPELIASVSEESTSSEEIVLNPNQ